MTEHRNIRQYLNSSLAASVTTPPEGSFENVSRSLKVEKFGLNPFKVKKMQ